MSNYLKPQSPLYHKAEDTYFYPLTTADQIIVSNDERLNTLFKKTIRESITLQAANWSTTKPYTQTITLSEYIDDYRVDANVVYGSDDDSALNKAAGCLTYIEKNHNEIIFYCLKDKPEIDIPIEIIGTCRNTIANIIVEGGIDLNFEVVGGTTEPTNPTENMIWVNTENEITGWYFSATQPDNMAEGEVWFATGDSSEAAFEALKKSGIRVYPLECKQMISGELKGVAFTIYQNGAWVEWWHGELYDSGNEYTFITGGWQARGLKVDSGNNAAAPTIVKGSNNVTISQSSFACGGVYEIVKDFDLTEFNTLTFNVAVGSETGVFGLIVYDRNITSTGSGSEYFTNTLAYKQLQPGNSGSFNIDVSGINKAACIGIAVYNWVAAVTPYVTMTKAFVS